MANRDFPLPTPAADVTQRDIYSIARLVSEARKLLERGFAEIWVEGEITNLTRAGSGHWYFSLKDAAAEVRCALFRSRAELLDATLMAEGNQILARVRVTLYEPRGAFQLIVQHLESAGEGALRQAFEALKSKLHKEGLFDTAIKKSLPPFPATVGLITSPSGAALHDLLTTFQRRCPAIRLIVYPTSVQGDRAPSEIISALTSAEQRRECDVLILARGGGSLEDLKAFNDEGVARAVHACTLPIVCGVGHEIDLTICDLVADQRAATPTAAAELVSPNRDEWLQRLHNLRLRLDRTIRHFLRTEFQRSDELGRRLVHPRHRLERGWDNLRSIQKHLRHMIAARMHMPSMSMLHLEGRLRSVAPSNGIRTHLTDLKESRRRLQRFATQVVQQRELKLQGLAARLNNVSPLATLERGYAMVTAIESGKIVIDPADAPVGVEVDVRLARGGLRCKVQKHEH